MNTELERILSVNAAGTYLNLPKRLAPMDLLILEDCGINPLSTPQYQDLYNIFDESTDQQARILSSCG
jgi:hypothetical protein